LWLVVGFERIFWGRIIMKKRLSIVLAVMAAITLLGATAMAQEPQAAIGQPAPDFTTVDESGATHALSQYRGQVVVLEWTNPGCPFVQRCYNSGAMQATAAAFAGQPVVWLAVDSSRPDEYEDSAAWKASQSISYPILQDREGQIGHLYGAQTTPHVFVVDAEGILRYAGAFTDDARGESASPTNYVSQAVTALLGGQEPAVTSTEPWGCSVKYQE
jgi:peroxiredoxin